jgi:hypothetical protein
MKPNNLLHFSAVVPPDSVDMENKTFRVLVNSGDKVMRYGWEGQYWLTLSMDPAHVRFDRINAGSVPLMKDHAAYSIDSQLGVVLSAELQQGKLYAECRMAADETKYLARLAEGTLRNVSPGVFVYALKDVTPEGASTKEFLAVDWEPYEISMVAVPADKNAQVLSLAEALSLCEAPASDSTLEESMNENLNPGQAAATPPADPKATTLAQQEERQRVLGIQKLANTHQMSADFVASHISEGTALSEVQSLILGEVAKRSEQNPTNPQRGEVIRDRFDSVRTGLEQALQYRVESNMGTKKRVELKEGKEFQGFTLLEMCRAYLQSQGVKEMPANRMSLVAAALGFERLAGQHSTSDFPNILANVANKSLLQGYEYANPTYRVWARRSTSPDFKSISRTQFGDFPALTKVNEGGEFKYGTIGDAAETYALATYGRIVAITRQAIINDDLDAFSRVPMNIGAAAAHLENFTVYQILSGNPNMRDGVALFHTATHGNLASSNSAINLTSLGLMRTAMRRQKGLDGTVLVNLTPRFLIVPPELETIALQQTSSEYSPESPGNVNPFKGTLTPVVDAQLTNATAWYGAADANIGNTVEYAFLEGQEGVYTEQRVGFEVDGIQIKARLDFAAKALDWRGLYKNNGS